MSAVRKGLFCLACSCLFLACSSQGARTGGGLALGKEYVQYGKGRPQSSSSTERSLARSIVLYIPNRFLDAVDIFRVDLGVGPASGVVVRASKWMQVGVRSFTPASLRVGLRGRASPVFLERTSEMGIGPTFLGSRERRTTPLEFGAGLDIFLVGAYGGISIDSAFDFVLGFVGIDISDDDLR